jgi:hypothetical protein
MRSRLKKKSSVKLAEHNECGEQYESFIR